MTQIMFLCWTAPVLVSAFSSWLILRSRIQRRTWIMLPVILACALASLATTLIWLPDWMGSAEGWVISVEAAIFFYLAPPLVGSLTFTVLGVLVGQALVRLPK